MNEYITSYRKTAEQVTSEPPACAEGKEHCWHVPTGGYASNARGYDEVCCWCGCTKENRRNPDAHGPHDPSRVYGGLQAVILQGNAKLDAGRWFQS